MIQRTPAHEQHITDQRAALGDDAANITHGLPGSECPTCGTKIGPASLVELWRVGLTDDKAMPAARLAFFCGHCQHIVSFNVDVDRQTGKCRHSPTWARSFTVGKRKIAQFLEAHPEAREVIET